MKCLICKEEILPNEESFARVHIKPCKWKVK